MPEPVTLPFEEALRIGACLTIETWDLDGRLLERDVQHNLTMLFGKKLALALLFGLTQNYVLGIACGDNNTTAAPTDATLYHELIRLPLVSISEPADNGLAGVITVRAIMSSTTGNGNTYREAALVNTLTPNQSGLYNRVTFADKVKSSSKIIVFQFDFTLT